MAVETRTQPSSSRINHEYTLSSSTMASGTYPRSNEDANTAAPRIRRPRPDTEEIRRTGRQHYQELISFLRSHLAKSEQTQPRSSAREKLTRLSKQQFTELSTDVYDELMRRLVNSKAEPDQAVPRLPVREEFHPKRNQARQKLATLPRTRFKELASDVFFELERRYPELREEFRPEAVEREAQLEREASEAREREANEAREQARAAEKRVRDEKRAAEEAAKPKFVAQPSTANVIVPAKSTLVEENIAVPYSRKNGTGDTTLSDNVRSASGWRGRSSVSSEVQGGDSDDEANGNVNENRSTMYSQASSVGTGFVSGYGQMNSPQVTATSTFGIEKLRSDYEFRVATLQKQITTLETQNSELKERNDELAKSEKEAKDRELAAREERVKEVEKRSQAHDTELRALREQARSEGERHDQKHVELQNTLLRLEELEKQHRKLGDQHRDLKDQHRDLQDQQHDLSSTRNSDEQFDELQKEFYAQETLVQELKGEVSALLEELRQLSGRNDEMLAEKESDITVIKDLNQQLTSYKRMYESAKTELRSLKATSQLWVQQPKPEGLLEPSDRGVISDVHLTAFQRSVDELLAAGRSKLPSSVLLAMKHVVLATTLITDDIVKHEPHILPDLTPEEVDQLQSHKSKCSATLNNLMTACRNHATSQGISPVSLLDAAASHVSTTIVDLVRLVKVRKATSKEAEEFESTFAGSGVRNGLRPLHTNASANTSTSNPPFSPVTSNGANGRSDARLDPNNASEDRFSPRNRAQPTMGRYSPVGYKPDITRKDSAGEGSWRAEAVRRRALSTSSASSQTNAPDSQDSVPAVPDVATALRTQSLSKSVSNGSTQSRGRLADLEVTPASRQDSSTYSVQPRSGSSSASLSPSSPAPMITPAPLSSEPGEENWAELRKYIKVQIAAIMHSIQALLSAIQEGAQGVQLNEGLTQITTIVSSIVAISGGNLPEASREKGERILAELTDNCERLGEMQSRSVFDKRTKSAMGSASYSVAKGLKALDVLLGEVE